MKLVSIWHGAVYAEYQQRYAELARLGVDATLIIPERWGAGLVRKTHAERLPNAPFKIVQLPVGAAWHGATFTYRGLAAVLDREQPDLVECIEEPFSRAARQAARWRTNHPNSRLIVSTCQNIFKRYPWPFSCWERNTLAQADALTGLNAESLDVFRRKGFSGPTAVVPTGIDPSVFHPQPEELARCRKEWGIEPGLPIIGYLGRLVEEKGVETLLKAAKHLATPVAVVLIGEGPDQPRLRQLADQLGLGQTVVWWPSLALPEVAAALSAMQILVLPSLTRSNWKEQFGRVLVEAMACGANVIGSDSGEIPQVIGDAGLTFKEGDDRELAKCLERLVSDRAVAEELRGKGLKRVTENYTWEIIARNLLRFIEDLPA